MWFDDQGKQYRSSNDVKLALIARGLLPDPATSETETETGGETSEYEASPVKQPKLQEVLVWQIYKHVCCVFNSTMLLSLHRVPVELPTSLFIGQLSQFQPLLDFISAVRRFTTPFYRGIYSVQITKSEILAVQINRT